jgi:hypothetical protein
MQFIAFPKTVEWPGKIRGDPETETKKKRANKPQNRAVL